MRKSTRNYLLVLIMFLLALFQVVSGFVLWLVLPRGGGYMGGRGLTEEAVFLWSRDTWSTFHNWVAVGLLVMVVIHIILHWRWIVFMTKASWAKRAITKTPPGKDEISSL